MMDAGPGLDHAPVRDFVIDELLGKLEFNEQLSAGAHALFIVRAAKAAGLTVRKIGAGHFFFDNSRCIGAVEAMIPSLVSHAALKVARSKHLTKELLNAAGVPVPSGKLFLESELVEARRNFRKLTTAAVVKPNGGRGGAGVTCGITSVDDFNEAWTKATDAKGADRSIVIEEMVAGVDTRVYVVDEEVVAATSRLPAYVVADGKNTIAELLELKQEYRNRHQYLARMPIVVDGAWVTRNGWTMESVPPVGEIVVLNPTANIHQGGENVDVTGILDPRIGELAVSVTRAIPGMGAAGVDIIAPSPRRSDGAVVLEVNTAANISVHHLPAYGAPVDVGRAIVDAMVARSR